MAEAKGCTTAQLALAWVLAQGEDVGADPRHRSIVATSTTISDRWSVKLSAEDLQRLDDDPAAGRAAGTGITRRGC